MPQGTGTNDTIYKSEACIPITYKAFLQDCDSVEIKRCFLFLKKHIGSANHCNLTLKCRFFLK